MTHLSIAVLGTLQIKIDGETAVGFDSNKVKALLVYLAIESDRLHARESLASLFWSEFDDRKALSNLRYALANLRKVIHDHTAEPPFLDITTQTIQFNSKSNYTLDIAEFEQKINSKNPADIQDALDYYDGPFLQGFAVASSLPFEEWLIHKREQIHQQVLHGLLTLTEISERHGDYEQAIHYAQMQLELEPWQESAYRQLMRIYASTHQRAKAIEQFEHCANILAEELGVEPSEETVDLYEQIRDEKFEYPVVVPEFLRQSEVPSPAIIAPLFVGRHAEMLKLDTFFQQMLQKEGQVLFIKGSAGSGKTMLMQAFGRQVLAHHPEVIIVSGRCDAQLGIGDPYAPFLEIMAKLGGDIETQWASQSISHPQALRLWDNLPLFLESLISSGSDLIDRFVHSEALLQHARVGAPELVPQLTNLMTRGNGSSLGLQQQDLFAQYTRVLQVISVHTPLLLIIDDLHWADTGTTSLLFHLGRRLQGHCILILSAYRPEHLSSADNPALLTIINEFQRQHGNIFIDLAQSNGYEFVESLVDAEPNRLDAEFREKFYQHTQGHPLFTSEMLKTLQNNGNIAQDEAGLWYADTTVDWTILPPQTEAVISERMRRLPAQHQTVLQVASIEGESFTDGIVAKCLGMPNDELIKLLSGSLSKEYQLVTAEDVAYVNGQQLATYRFRHNLFQTYLYAQVDAVELAHFHADIGNAIEDVYGSHVPEMASRLAYHFKRGKLIEKAVQYLHQAGDHAVRLFANHEAIQHYQDALDLLQQLPQSPERIEQELQLRLALGVPLLVIEGFSSNELENNYRLALELSRQVDNPAAHFQVISGLKSFFDVRLSLPMAYGLAEEMLTIGNKLNDPTLKLFAHHHLCATALYMGDLSGCLENRAIAHHLYNDEQHREIAFRFGIDPEIAGLAHESWAHWFMGNCELAVETSHETLIRADNLGHPFMSAMAYCFAAQLAHWLGDRQRALPLAQTASEYSHKLGIIFWAVFADVMIAWNSGEESESSWELEEIEQVYQTTEAIGAYLMLNGLMPSLAKMSALLGNIDFGLDLIDRCLKIVKHSSNGRTMLVMSVSEVYSVQGELLVAKHTAPADQTAEQAFQTAIELARQFGSQPEALRGAIGLGRLWCQQGKITGAIDLLDKVCQSFTGQPALPEFQQAQQLLTDLKYATP